MNSNIPKGSKVLCALSGGMDSVCLTHLLASDPDITVAAAHFSHGIRISEAEKEYELCKSLCESLGISLFRGIGETPTYAAEKKVGLEEAARALRYRFLDETAEKWGADFIATAHHAQDNAETLLLNLTRGTGSIGCGIPRVRGKYVRPMLGWSREKIEKYIRTKGLSYCTDESNFRADNPRNIIRLDVLPALKKINPDAVSALSRSALMLREDGEFIKKEALEKVGKYDGCRAPAADFTASSPAFSGRMFRLLFKKAGGNLKDLSFEHYESFLALCASRSPSASLSLPCGITARREYDSVILEITHGEAELREAELKEGENIWGEYKLTLSPKAEKNTLPLPEGRVTVRPRIPGDQIEGISLKDRMINKKIPVLKRALHPVVCLNGEPIWSPGLGFKGPASGIKYLKTEKLLGGKL